MMPRPESPARGLAPWLCLLAFFAAAAPALAQNASPKTRARIGLLFKEARRAEQQRDLPAASKLYDRILKLEPSLAEVWTNKGLVLYELGKYREAVAAFGRAAVLKPQLLTPHLFLGITQLKLGETEQAVAPLRLVLAREPHHPQATYELAHAYLQMEQFELAAELYRDLVQRNPNLEQAWYRFGLCYLNWSKAVARKLVDSREPSPYGKILLGELQAVGGMLTEAEASFRAAVANAPGSVEARLALARFYLDLPAQPERIRLAQEQIAQAKKLDPRDPQVEIAWIRLALVENNFSEAIARLAKVLAADPAFARNRLPDLAVGLSPDSAKTLLGQAGGREPVSENELETTDLDSYSGRLQQLEQAAASRRLSLAEEVALGVAAWNLGEYDRALRALLDAARKSQDDRARYWLSLTCRALARETFLEAIRRNPESYRAHLLLADLANDFRDSAKALEEYEKAVSLGAADPEVHLLYIHFLVSKGRDGEALEKARAAIQKFPRHSALNCELGKLFLKMKSPQQAVPHFRRSLDADPSFTAARVGLADSYAAMGETERAIQEMKQALGADTDGSLHYRLGRWYQKTGQTREADQAFSVSTRLKEEKHREERAKLTATR